MGKPTQEDVARLAGVSRATVSYVINEQSGGNVRISDETRQRVWAAVKELGYQPNILARSLRSGETRTIGLIIPDCANPFFAEVARGIEDAAFEHGYNVVLCNSDGDLVKELRYLDVLASKQVDGILLVAAGASAENLRALAARGIPVVVVDRELPDAKVDSVLTDNERGGWLATHHLLSLGHTRISCIAGPSDVTPSAERVAGYRRALREVAVPVDEALIVRGDFQCESGHRAAAELLARRDPPTAIFACNDMMALGAVGMAASIGLKVPTDLSVVGFDDVRLASYSNPPLTTIVQPKYKMGWLAAEMLIERVRQPRLPPRRHMLDTRLLVRQSTAPLFAPELEKTV